MSQHNSRLLVLSDSRDTPEAEAAVAPLGWQCDREVALLAALARLADTTPAAVVVDLAAPEEAADALAAIRRLPAPLNGTPVLLVGDGGAPVSGAGGTLARPWDEAAFVDLLRRWAGPLEDHALRETPWDARYRLIRLLGLEAADAMLLRLRDTLSGTIDSDSGEPPPAHRLAGIAGLCGFTDLSQAWARADRQDHGALEGAIAASREVIDQIDRALG